MELGKKEGDGVFEGGGGWYPNAHYAFALPFHSDKGQTSEGFP